MAQLVILNETQLKFIDTFNYLPVNFINFMKWVAFISPFDLKNEAY